MRKTCVVCGEDIGSSTNLSDGKLYCWRHFQAALEEALNPFSRKTRKAPPEPAPPEWGEFLAELPSLMRYCHPDKHGNSVGSTRITQWLLEVRKKHGSK